MRTPRTPIRFTDADGHELVRVPLAKGAGAATLDAADFDRMTAAGLPDQWSLNRNATAGSGYVKARISHDNSRVVARVITGAEPGTQVRYRDGDRLNLRRDNLCVVRGGMGRYDASALLARVEKIAVWNQRVADSRPASDDSDAAAGMDLAA